MPSDFQGHSPVYLCLITFLRKLRIVCRRLHQLNAFEFGKLPMRAKGFLLCVGERPGLSLEFPPSLLR